MSHLISRTQFLAGVVGSQVLLFCFVSCNLAVIAVGSSGERCCSGSGIIIELGFTEPYSGLLVVLGSRRISSSTRVSR